jgi:mRNA interferase HigB
VGRDEIVIRHDKHEIKNPRVWEAREDAKGEGGCQMKIFPLDLTHRLFDVTFCNIMHIIAARTLEGYIHEFKEAATWLGTFLERAEAAKWNNIADIRRIYPHADTVKVRSGNDVVVLNACGNKYRLIVAIHFNRGKVYILRFMTHAEYDKDMWKDQL